ncbi:MAG: AsmA-like C-terminal region-containing protein [Hyphomicrobiales bacterium]
MKKFLKIVSVVIVVIILAMIILPYAFKGSILRMVKSEAEKYVDAKVEFTDVSLSFFRNFPNLSAEIENISIVGVGKFDGDTLVSIPSVYASFDLSSVWSGDNYKINSVEIKDPYVMLHVLEDGKANWDIAKSEEATGNKNTEEVKTPQVETDNKETSEKSSSMEFGLESFVIDDARIIYMDESSKMLAGIDGLDFSLSGDLSEDKTRLKIKSEINSLTYEMDGLNYLKSAELSFDASVEADLKNMIFTFMKNELKLNDLALKFEGSVSMLPEDAINVLLSFSAPKTEFKSILSMIPSVYLKDFQDIKTSGSFNLDGSVKGIYKGDSYPSFDINLNVNDGVVKYPSLPASVNDINIAVKVKNKGGDLDNTIVNVSKFGLNLADNPVKANMFISHPMSDPYIKGSVSCDLDLVKLKDAIPLEADQKLKGRIKADVSLEGKMSTIEKEQYEDFLAIGTLLVQDVDFQSKDLPPVVVKVAQLNFSPKYLDLVSFKSRIGSGDFSASGKVTNYLGYVFRNDVLKASLTTTSNEFNLNDFIAEAEPVKEKNVEKKDVDTSTSEKKVAVSETKQKAVAAESSDMELEVFKVPENIDFDLKSTFGKLMYDNLTLQNVKGNIQIKNGTVLLKPLKGEIFDGKINMDGSYVTKDVPNAKVDFNINVENMDIHKTFNAVATMQKLAPSAKFVNGKFSVNMNFKSNLDDKMMPEDETIQGYGQLKTSYITIKDQPALEELAKALKKDDLKTLELNKVNLSFKIIDGKVITTPFDIKSGNYKATIEGWTSFAQDIDYDITLFVPRKDFGGDANNALQGLVDLANKNGANFSLGSTVKIGVKVTGKTTKPKVKLNVFPTNGGDSGSVGDVISNLLGGSGKKDDNLSKEELLAKADQIEKDADIKAKQDIEKAEKEIEKQKANALKEANKLIAEGKKNGFLGEVAAKKAAELLKNNADKLAIKLMDEAKKSAEKRKADAKKEADKLREKAKNK